MYKQLHIKCICIEEPVIEFVPDYEKKEIMASCSQTHGSSSVLASTPEQSRAARRVHTASIPWQLRCCSQPSRPLLDIITYSVFVSLRPWLMQNRCPRPWSSPQWL